MRPSPIIPSCIAILAPQVFFGEIPAGGRSLADRSIEQPAAAHDQRSNHKGKLMTDSGQEETPYANLTPDTVLDAIEAIGYRCDGRLMALNSFENRVYQVGADDRFLIAKFYRPGRWNDAAIIEEHQFTADLVAAEVPVVPPMTIAGQTLHPHQGHRFALFERRGGRAPELEDPQVLERIGLFLGRLHRVGAECNFAVRPRIDIEHFGRIPLQILQQQNWIPAELQAAWAAVTERALEGIADAFERAGAVQSIRLHGDCHAGNILWTDQGPHFVDLDDARGGPAVQDLWMLLSGDAASQALQLGHVLRGYERFRDFDRRELQLIEALRTLRYLHYTAWIASRWSDPAFPAAFPWFGTNRDWQERILALREQLAAMAEPPLEVWSD